MVLESCTLCCESCCFGVAEPRAGGEKPGVGRRHGGGQGAGCLVRGWSGTLASVVSSSGTKLFNYVYFCPMCFRKYLT